MAYHRNVTVSIDEKRFHWFKDYCSKQNAKMSTYFDEWLKEFIEQAEKPQHEHLWRCRLCNYVVSDYEYRRLFMTCPQCKGIATFKEMPNFMEKGGQND